jgi:hypothetical protein
MRSFGLKFAIVLFAVLLDWTSVEAETCTRLLKRVCLSDPTLHNEYCQKVVQGQVGTMDENRIVE